MWSKRSKTIRSQPLSQKQQLFKPQRCLSSRCHLRSRSTNRVYLCLPSNGFRCLGFFSSGVGLRLFFASSLLLFFSSLCLSRLSHLACLVTCSRLQWRVNAFLRTRCEGGVHGWTCELIYFHPMAVKVTTPNKKSKLILLLIA